MQFLIDNLDGLGLLDYSGCVVLGRQSRITRVLNKPSFCTFDVVSGVAGRKMPVALARVEVAAADGTSLFSGYVVDPPSLVSSGLGSEGACYTALVTAVSDDAALDAGVTTAQAMLLGQTLEQDWNALTASAASVPTTIAVSEKVPGAGRVEILSGSRWTEAAEMLANQSMSAYRAVKGSVAVSALGEVSHAVAADDPGLKLVPVNANDLRWLASDVTVCGREEPAAYVTEVFAGDGVTTSFVLTDRPFAPVAQQKTLISDLFQGTSLNPRVWAAVDPAGHLALTAQGLTCGGGTGRPDETTVAAVQAIELGGLVTVEGSGVQITAGSAGIVLGLYTNKVAAADCFAGFQISSAGSSTSVAAIVNGGVAGSSFQPAPGHLYTFQLRVFSQEMERVRQTYHYMSAAGPAACGGETVASSGLLEFAVQDTTNGVPGAPVILYSGSVGSVPAACLLGLFDSGSLACSVKSVQSTQTGPLYVTIAAGAGGGAPVSQVIGTTAEGGACHVTTTGTLTFYPGTVPAAGALIYVTYRTRARAVARRIASGTANESGIPATAMWIGTVTAPVAWSSVDCDAAATALLGIAANASTALKGSYKVTYPPAGGDIWPGDSLVIGPYVDGSYENAIVREVEVALEANLPDALPYTVKFANDWADSLSLRLSTAVPLYTVIPQQATDIESALPGLSSMTAANISGSSFELEMGVSAPVNGGFEVRRRDNTFGPGVDSDLVLRSSTSSISVPRFAAVEQYYVRMYDGAAPPNYSLFSAALFLNVPL